MLFNPACAKVAVKSHAQSTSPASYRCKRVDDHRRLAIERLVLVTADFLLVPREDTAEFSALVAGVLVGYRMVQLAETAWSSYP